MWKPNAPENLKMAEGYEDVSIDPNDYEGKSVLILGYKKKEHLKAYKCFMYKHMHSEIIELILCFIVFMHKISVLIFIIIIKVVFEGFSLVVFFKEEEMLLLN